MSQQALIEKHLSTLQSPEDANSDISQVVSQHLPNSSSSEPIIDPESRIEFLERSLQYIQQQHESTLVDLHNEINRLQQENTDLHYRLMNNQSSSDQKEKNSDSDTDNHSHFEQRLIESEQKNKHLMYKIDELNQIISSRFETTDRDGSKTPRQTIDTDYQHLFSMTDDKQHLIQDIAKLQSALVEILNTERLSIASKILLRDCLTSTNTNETFMNKTTTTPIDMLFINENQQQKPIASSITSGKASARPSTSQHRLSEQRANLPPIISSNNPLVSQDPTGMNSVLRNSLSPTNYSHQQHLLKVGETPIARRERRTQELQKNRLMRNLYH